MVYSYLIPEWFFGFDVAMEIIFALITFVVACYSYRIYKLSGQNNVRLFSVGFLFIALSYGLWAIVNLVVATKLQGDVLLVTLANLQLIGILGIYAHMILSVTGLVTLAYATLNVKKGAVYYLMLSLSFLVLAASYYKLITFRILSVFLIAFITYHYLWEYLDHKNRKTRHVFTAFVLLLLSNIDFTFSLQYPNAYVIGHLLEFGAYLLIAHTALKTARS